MVSLIISSALLFCFVWFFFVTVLRMSSNNNSSSGNVSASGSTRDHCSIYSTCNNVSFLPGTSTVVTEWSLVCDQGWALNVIFTVQMVGVVLGAYLIGHLGDSVGQRASLYGMVKFYACVNVLAAACTSWEMFAFVRFFIGIAVGGILATGYAIPLEFTSEFWRGILGTLPIWSIGSASFAVAVTLLKDWRHIHILSAVVSCTTILPEFWVPEGFRWLAVNGRDVQVGAVATKMAKMNKRPLPSLELVASMAESERRRVEVESSTRYSYLYLFRDTLVRELTTFMALVLFFMSIIYFGISFNVTALSGDFYINFLILSVMELPTILFSLPTMSFLTRRWGSVLHLFVVSIACFGVTIATLTLGGDPNNQDTETENGMKEKIILGLMVIAKIGILCAWNFVSIFCVELFPTAVRNLAFRYCNTLTRIGGLIGPVLFPKNPALLYVAMLCLGVITILCVILVLLLPETKGAPLEDMLRSKNFLDKNHDKPSLEDVGTERHDSLGLLEVGERERVVA